MRVRTRDGGSCERTWDACGGLSHDGVQSGTRFYIGDDVRANHEAKLFDDSPKTSGDVSEAKANDCERAQRRDKKQRMWNK